MRTLVIGAGEVGFQIASKLVQEKIDVVLIDVNGERLDQVSEILDVQTVCGYGANPETLTEAGLETADLLIAVTGNDETNILACRMAQLLAPVSTQRVARIKASGYYDLFDEKKFRSDFGINFVINPALEAVNTIIDFLDFPGATDIINVSGGRLRLVGLKLPKNHHLVDLPLSVSLPRQQAATILITAIYRHQDLLIPRGDTVLRGNDLVYVAATKDHFGQILDFFDLDQHPVRSVIIVGGGEVGYLLAKRLEVEDKRLQLKLIETDPERCEYLSSRLGRTMVIKGDGTDHTLLSDENVDDCDMFIALSTDDEKNMISCLVAKRLGAKHTISRVNRFSYAPLIASIGLESLISARVAAVSAILKYIRKGRVVSVATLANEDAEFIEFQVLPKSKVVGLSMMDAPFPHGAIVAALTRNNDVIIPRGDTVIEVGDILAIVAKAEAILKLEKILGGR